MQKYLKLIIHLKDYAMSAKEKKLEKGVYKCLICGYLINHCNDNEKSVKCPQCNNTELIKIMLIN